MGAPDNALKAYMCRQDRIRSVLEYYLGERLPEDWECREMSGFYTIRNARGKLSFRQRDFIGEVRACGIRFRLGLENPAASNLTYPWRLMEMDCLAYGNEIAKIQEQNEANHAIYGEKDDFQYRYLRGDRLEPVLNLTLYWGRKPWTGPLSLREMLEDTEPLPGRLRGLVGDYKVHLIPMRDIPEENLQKMDSDLKYVLGIMKCSRSKRKYNDYIMKNREYFSRIPKSAVDVIDVCTGISDITGSLEFLWNLESGEEEADMCKALRDIKKDAEKRGRRKGRQEGRQEGVFMALCALVRDGMLQLDEAAKRAGLTAAVFRERMQKAGY